MDRTRGIRVGVVVNQLPNMLQDITVTVLAAASDIEMVTIDPRDGRDLIAQADAARLDALVTAAGPEPLPPDLLFARPRMAVVEVAPDGRSSTLHRLRPARRAIRRLSPATLLRALRDTVEALREGRT